MKMKKNKYCVYERKCGEALLSKTFDNREDAVKHVINLANEYVNILKCDEEIDKYEAEDIMWYVRSNQKNDYEVYYDYELHIAEI